MLNEYLKRFFIVAKSFNKTYFPAFADTMPEDADSYEINVFYNCNVRKTGEKSYKINDILTVYDTDNLMSQINASHIVVLTHNKYDGTTGLIYSAKPRIIYAGYVDKDTSSDFHMFFYFKGNSGSLYYDICDSIQSCDGVIEKAAEMNANYVVSFVTNVFTCKNVEAAAFNNMYCEIITDDKLNRLLNFNGIDKALHEHKIVMTAVVGYTDFQEDFFGITDHLFNDVDFFE